MRRASAALLPLLLLPGVTRADEEVVKRPVPDYDGRLPAEPGLASDLLVIPEVALAPLYLASEYLLRRPILFGLEKLEDAHVFTEVSDGKGHLGVKPVFSWDRTFAPQLGVYLDYARLFVAGNDLGVEGTIWWDHAALVLHDRLVSTSGELRLDTRAAYEGSSDAEFFGLGPSSSPDARSRYQVRRGEAGVTASWRPGGHERAALELGWRGVDFGPDACCDDPSVAERAASGAFPLPPGLTSGYQGPFGGVRLALDDRRAPTDTGTGIALTSGLASDLGGGAVWLTTGARVGGSINLTGHQRMLSLTLDARLASLLAGDAIPFTELPALGGAEPLPGFGPRRLVDRSALALTADYEWPIWGYAVGQLQLAAGDVFGAHFDGVDLDLTRLSTGIGICTRSAASERDARPYRLQLFFGLGTAPLGQGFSVDSVRVSLLLGL